CRFCSWRHSRQCRMPLKGGTCNGGTACRTSGTPAGYTWCTAGHTSQYPGNTCHGRTLRIYNHPTISTPPDTSHSSWNSNKDRLLNRFSITSCLCCQYNHFFSIEKVPSSTFFNSERPSKGDELFS